MRVLDAGRIALAADTLGACERAIEMAVAYAKQREQFGRAIGSFQAVKHLCAEMVAELEPARSLVWYAAHAFDARPDEAAQLAAHAKAHLAEIGTAIVRTATEVHGGIGFTDEHDLHLWFKRVGVEPPAARRPRARARRGCGAARLVDARRAQIRSLTRGLLSAGATPQGAADEMLHPGRQALETRPHGRGGLRDRALRGVEHRAHREEAVEHAVVAHVRGRHAVARRRAASASPSSRSGSYSAVITCAGGRPARLAARSGEA